MFVLPSARAYFYPAYSESPEPESRPWLKSMLLDPVNEDGAGDGPQLLYEP